MRNAYRRTGVPPAAVMLLLLAGCAAPGPPAPAPDPEPEPVAVEAASPLPAPPVEPVTPPPPAPTVQPSRAEIAVVLDADTPAHVTVADEIVAALSPRLYRVTRVTTAEPAALEALQDRAVTIVAVGGDAVRAARAALPNKPLVFCQVPDAATALQAGGSVWGVQSLPPLALQLKSWQAVDPSLRTIALIVSASGAAMADEARLAATALATDLLVETSASDRETLYLFRRLATAVDGLWLLPDNEALSPQVLRELLSYAAARGIGVLTFNEALLSRGALLTATAVPADIAATVQHVVERVVAGRTAGLPAMTPLSAAELTINTTVASELGLPPVLEQRWVAREPD
jgi:ABC-type uncharacterized transport system substrate-binding protein